MNIDKYLTEAPATVPFKEGDVVKWKGKEYTVLEVYKAMKKAVLVQETFLAPFDDITMVKPYK